MDIDISPQNEQFLQDQIAAGVYSDREQALNAAISLLREQTSVLTRIDRARQQLDAGDSVEYDEASLANRFQELKSRVSRLSNSSAGES